MALLSGISSLQAQDSPTDDRHQVDNRSDTTLGLSYEEVPMRPATILSALLLCLPATLDAQSKTKSVGDLERFEVSGLPATPNSDLERQIFLFLRAHRKGDLTDATRIHMLLAPYYKEIGDQARANICSRRAADAWEVGSKAPPETAASPGTPPFSPERTFRRSFTYTDDLNVAHTWEFYLDGTVSHGVMGGANEVGPTEFGWYSRTKTQMRLWQLKNGDRTVDFELFGPDGADGAKMAGVLMKSA